MGLFSRKKRNKETVSDKTFMTVEEALNKSQLKNGKSTKENIISLVHEDCTQYLDLKKQEQEHKAEYDAVTAYLSDIQSIERLNGEDRVKINEYAAGISNIEKERRKQVKKERTLPEHYYRRMEQYEDIIPDEMRKMQERESYQQLVQNDINQLEGEKSFIKYEWEECRDKKQFLKRLAIYGSILSLGVFILLFALSEYYEKDFLLPFLLTGLMALAIAAYVVTGNKKYTAEQRKCEMRMNRAISLMNKVKIKYVNCTSSLDYTYEKFGVGDYRELASVWEEYVKEKDEERRLKQSSELLDYYQKELMRELSRIGVSDNEVWLHQTEALVDKKEMVEVRHRLNERRQKLRSQIEFDVKQKDITLNQLSNIINTYSEEEKTIRDIAADYGIEL